MLIFHEETQSNDFNKSQTSTEINGNQTHSKTYLTCGIGKSKKFVKFKLADTFQVWETTAYTQDAVWAFKAICSSE